MIARIVGRTSFWIGMVAVVAMPFVPLAYRWFYPPRKPLSESQGFWQMLGVALDSLNSFSDGVAIFLWIGGLAALASIASVAAFFAAWRAQEPTSRRVLCGLPILLAVVMWVFLILLT